MNLTLAGQNSCCQSADRAAALEHHLARIADAGPEAINDRMAQLDREWSASRVTRAALAVLMLAGVALAVAHSSWWLILPGVAGLLFLQYLFARDCMVCDVAHASGFRTGREIEEEKFALKALRGDFRHLPTVHDVQNPEDISRLEGEAGS